MSEPAKKRAKGRDGDCLSRHSINLCQVLRTVRSWTEQPDNRGAIRSWLRVGGILQGRNLAPQSGGLSDMSNPRTDALRSKIAMEWRKLKQPAARCDRVTWPLVHLVIIDLLLLQFVALPPKLTVRRTKEPTNQKSDKMKSAWTRKASRKRSLFTPCHLGNFYVQMWTYLVNVIVPANQADRHRSNRKRLTGRRTLPSTTTAPRLS